MTPWCPDPADFREQIQNRVTRDDSDACLTLNFVPVDVKRDVRALVCGTLAGETGLVTGPQPMFQVQFLTHGPCVLSFATLFLLSFLSEAIRCTDPCSVLSSAPPPSAQVWFHTSHIDVSRPLVFSDKDFDSFQRSCPVTRLEFVPGQRPENDLTAPEVKFVRKKAVKENSGPLGFISNILSNKSDKVSLNSPLVRYVHALIMCML